MKNLISLGERGEWNAEAEEALQTESFSEEWPIDVPLPAAEPMLTIEALRARAESNTTVLEDILHFELTCRAREQPK